MLRKTHGFRARVQRGFTLIELMVTVAIAAIIAMVAMPAYNNYVTRGYLTEAFNQLSALSMALEQYYQDNRTYVGACGATGTSLASLPSNTAHFSYQCGGLTGASSAMAATGYTIQATGLTGTNTASFVFTLNQAGARATTSAPTGWPTSATCWINGASGSCQ